MQKLLWQSGDGEVRDAPSKSGKNEDKLAFFFCRVKN